MFEEGCQKGPKAINADHMYICFLIITCDWLTGEPVPEVIWYKDETRLEQSERTKMAVDAGTGLCTLEIRDATEHDSGKYTVQLANDVSRPR